MGKQDVQNHVCALCGKVLQVVGGLEICLGCNDQQGMYVNYLSSSICDFSNHTDTVLIQCPGATLYRQGGNEIIAGVRFVDNDNPSSGFEIVNYPIFGPKHVRRRWVRKHDAHLIRRCQSCQDYTIRMRRREGPDLYIPSRRGGHRHNRDLASPHNP